jgi:crotonobetainyl-CoA:carnitine CoA-transferase CaiB-like acyl-CoA transferase
MGPDGFEAQMGAVPEIGQHNEAILAELGMDTDIGERGFGR